MVQHSWYDSFLWIGPFQFALFPQKVRTMRKIGANLSKLTTVELINVINVFASWVEINLQWHNWNEFILVQNVTVVNAGDMEPLQWSDCAAHFIIHHLLLFICKPTSICPAKCACMLLDHHKMWLCNDSFHYSHLLKSSPEYRHPLSSMHTLINKGIRPIVLVSQFMHCFSSVTV